MAEIIFRANDGDPNKGADMIDALYYRENIDRNKVNEIVDSFSALVRQERPEIFSTPSAREQEIERGMQEVEYAGGSTSTPSSA